MREIYIGLEARTKIISGVTKLNSAVSSTLGPNGKYALFANNYGEPQITKDGVAVSNEVMNLECKVESLAIKAIQQAASKTAEIAGDGTTTCTVVATNLIINGLEAINGGHNAVQLIKGYKDLIEQVIVNLDGLAKPCNSLDSIKHVATISANNDEELGSLIAEAIDKAGNDGIVTIEDSPSKDTYLETLEGYIIPKGYASDYFSTEGNKSILDNPYILISNKNIETAIELVPILTETTKAGKPLLIIAPKIATEALNGLIANHRQGTIRVCCVTLPGTLESRLEDIRDIATATGGRVIDDINELSVSTCKLEDLGSAEKVITGKESCTIIKGNQKDLQLKIISLKSMMESSTSQYVSEKLQERIAKLIGGICILKVGASTSIELIEKKARIEDAMHATKAAISGGIVPGGGVALLSASKSINVTLELEDSQDSYKVGKYLAAESLQVPLKLILSDETEKNLPILIDSDNWYCYNVSTSIVEDALKSGVIDPLLVSKQVLINALSVACAIINTNVIITETN